MELFCDEIGISKSHLKETISSDRFLLTVNKNWLKFLKLDKKIYDFPTYKPSEKKILPDLGHPWTKTYVQVYKKYNHKVLSLPKPRNEENSELPMTYSEILNYVSCTNYKSLWEIGHKKYTGSHVKYAKQHMNGSLVSPYKRSNLDTGSHLIAYDVLLKDLIQRIFQCSIIHFKLDRIKTPISEQSSTKDQLKEDECHQNILSALIGIETSTCILVIFYPPSIECTLYDCITYSPAILNRNYNKSMFILYQILHLLKNLHNQNILLGDIHLTDIYLHENLWLQIIPKLESNLIQLDAEMESSALIDSPQEESLKFDLKFIYDVDNFSLREYCEMWCNGQLSNFDYLTILNQASGRRIGVPGNHHIMPWVTDFFQRNGANWRDLTKSKYRINKGDPHLDLIFTAASVVAEGLEAYGSYGSVNNIGIPSANLNLNAVPHHVSDFLSEITYFVYMARRTPQNVLCQHVRPIWVPAEYPVSIQRLQEWTPDECIPEFYTDPMVFKSIHEDLPDLEIPPWTTCPEDFVAKHREALESQYVSERLQHWIDLNFGYKLSGKAAIKSKNVCLSLVDNHKNLTQRGIVQLFNHPHPPKRFPSQWFGRSAPRLLTEEQQKRRLARSTDNLVTLPLNESNNTTSTSSFSFNSHRQRNLRGDPSPHRRIHQHQKLSTHQESYLNLSEDINSGMERSSSFYQNLSNTIHLPKDYNPLSLLNNLENMETFFSKTFLDQKPPKNQEEKLEQNDMLFEESSDNSFTNRMFSENIGSSTSKVPKNGKPFIMGMNNQKDFSQIFEDKRDKELQVIGCIIAELFLMNRLRPLTMNSHNLTFEKRFKACRAVVSKFISEIPKSLHYAVKIFLGLDENACSIINDKGLPFPTAAMLLEPFLSNIIIPFPFNYCQVYLLFKSMHNFDFDSMLLSLYTHFSCDGKKCDRYADLDKKRVIISRKIAECKVGACSKLIEGLLDPVGYEQFVPVELLLQLVIDMLKTEETSILAAWNLFDPIAAALGLKDTQKYFLEPILKLYDPETEERTEFSKSIDSNLQIKFRTSSSFKARKFVKLYHHRFLLSLMVRFGLKCFLDNFIPPLIEAVGGFKEPMESSGYHYHSNKVNSAFMRRVRSTKNLKLNFNPDDNSDNSLTLISPDHSDLKSDPTISICENSLQPTTSQQQQPLGKNEIEDVFAFESELIMDESCDNRSNKSNIESHSLDSFDMPLGTFKAEEATEDIILSAEKLALNDIIYSGRLSNNSFDDDKISAYSQKDSPQKLDALGPTSPTIPIPSTFRRTYELSTIDCEIGSKKSIDSFDFGTQGINANSFMKASSVDRPNKIEVTEDSKENYDDENGAEFIQASVNSKRAELLSVHDNKISEVSTASIIWLSHRLGPVLTSKYLTRNLLRMLTLCYTGQENLLPPSEMLQKSEDSNNLNYFSVVDSKVVGDRCAARVLECLTQIAALFGEQFILLQYLPHVSELIALCKNKITASLEGALISSLQLLKCLIPCLNDRTIMEHLQDLILDNIINPVLILLSSTRCLMPSGYLGRSVLARKLLDAIYVICVRIGAEMSKEHICSNVLQKFFLIFDKAYGIIENYQISVDNNIRSGIKTKDNQLSISPYKNYLDESLDEMEQQAQERGLEEIRDVFSPNLAHSSYLAFLRYLGESIMNKTIVNLEFILTLCHEFEQPDYSDDSIRQKRRQIYNSNRNNYGNVNSTNENSSEEFHGSHSFGTFVIGNRIEVIKATSGKTEMGPMEVLDMVAHKFDNIDTKRHLKGNWLAYWRHEISRSEKDNHLSIKQIKLQTYSGHTNSVRAIISLDNENSFMSASKDKTVKLWSLRSEGDGTKITPCQFTYNSHKKSVHSLAFSEAMRFVISCDSGVHIWDPFIGRPIGILDSHRYSPVSIVRTFPSPSPLVIAGTADSCVRIIDSRVVEYVNEWKVTTNPNSTVRCLACSPNGNWIAIGLSSGNIILLDSRTGVVLRSWKATEGELLNLIAINDQQIISSCLDYSISVWNVNENHVQYNLKQPPEPAHCLCSNDSELIFGTPANRIGIYSDLNSNDSVYNITRLRSETLKGVMTSLTVLPLNRMVLAGTDGGNIMLLC